MQNKLINAGLFICLLLIFSCKAKKELANANTEITRLNEANGALAAKNSDLQKEVNNLMEGNKSVNQEYAAYKTDCEKVRQEHAEMEKEMDELANQLAAVMEKMQAAMKDFEEKGVEVYKKDGLIFVSLKDDLIYKSGSAALGAEGKKALGSLAAALNEYPDLKVIVVGNTDDVKFKKGGKDNLSLSTERANGVVRILAGDYKVDPSRLTAAGRGKYSPVADNSTAEGRAKNRRTEVILNPDMKKIWASVEK